MKRRYLFIFIFILLIFLSFNKVYASFSGSPGSSSYSGGGCNDCSWVYFDDGIGFRVSLYTYDGKKLTFIKSIDYVNNPGSIPNKIYKSNSRGRFNYTMKGQSVNFELKDKNLKKVTEIGASYIKTDEANWGVSLSNKIINYFGKTNEKIIENIKKVFDIKVSESELSKYYLLVEPTMTFYNRPYSLYTYGTGYEYVNSKNDFNKSQYTGGYSWGFWSSQHNPIVNILYNGLYMRTDSSKVLDISLVKGSYDYYNFVNPSSSKNPLITTTSSLTNETDILSSYSRKTYPYGASVLWLGYKASVDCVGTCSGKTGDEYLKCAESYCQKDSSVKNSNDKKDCLVKKCKYTYTKLSCGEDKTSNGKNTICSDKTSSTKETCDIINNTNYSYRVKCNVNSTVIYPTNLPANINAGDSFEYQPYLYGNKSCQIELDKELWKFNYASAYTNSERETYKETLNRYNNISLNNYFYDSKTAVITANISERIDGNNKKTNKILEPNSDYYTGNKDVIYTTTNDTVSSYKNGSKVSYDIKVYSTDSSNGIYYNLPSVCISNENNVTTYEGKTCKNGLGPYNKYYTNLSSEKYNNPVNTNVIHNESGLNVNNTCNYTIDDSTPFRCVIDVQTSSNQKGDVILNNEDITFTLRAVTEDKESTIRYNIGYDKKESNEAFNNKTRFVIDANTISEDNLRIVYGTITDGKRTAYCQKIVTNIPNTNPKCVFNKTVDNTNDTITLTLKSVSGKAKYYIKEITSNKWTELKSRTISKDENIKLIGKIVKDGKNYYCYYNQQNNGNETCTELYKPAEYLKIKNYCKSKWKTDTANYSSEDDCYISCTEGNNSCKKINKCDNLANIKTWCKINYQVDGYNSEEDCINDCGCRPNGIKYYYRPISITIPFPDRQAGYNWLGYEKYITDDKDDLTPSRGNTPEYQIVLDKKKMDKIKKDTKKKGASSYTDYYRMDNTDTGSYKSKFIHDDDLSDGGFNKYFTYIEGIKVGDNS